MNPKILVIHASFRGTTAITVCYNKHLQTFAPVIMDLCTAFTALSLFAHAKKGSNVTAAADVQTTGKFSKKPCMELIILMMGISHFPF